jgi:type III secretory pathway component EscR
MNNWISRKFGVGRQLGLACFASIAWATWLIRNKICIQHIFPNNSLDVVYLTLSFTQKWCILMKSPEKAKVEKMQECAKKFIPSDYILSDVGFI